jgi:hypothetical protein
LPTGPGCARFTARQVSAVHAADALTAWSVCSARENTSLLIHGKMLNVHITILPCV